MIKYVGIRLSQAIPVIVGISLVGFFLIHLVPGDPARIQLGPRAPYAAVRHLDHELGLDRSLWSQYASFASGAVHLDFGQSLDLHRGVGELIRSRAPVTGLLILYSLLISLVLTIPFAVIAAIRQDQPIDHAIRAVGMTLFVMPSFWLGLLLILLFGLELHLVPTGGYSTGLVGGLQSLTLPALTLALGMAPFFVRSLRAGLIEALDAPYAEAARARGFSASRVLIRHCLRNASLTTVTLVGLTVGWLISGTVVVENVFAIPGLGAMLVTSVSSRDFPTIQGLIVVFAVAVVVVNLLTDLSYAVLDPRVRL